MPAIGSDSDESDAMPVRRRVAAARAQVDSDLDDMFEDEPAASAPAAAPKRLGRLQRGAAERRRQEKEAREEARRVRKEQKKQQLALLLVNKFRNKFNVITTSEAKIDQHIIAQVQALLACKDQASQNGLKSLDIRLGQEIKKMREAP